MQTSNKLLLGGFIAALLSFVLFVSILRANIFPVNIINGNGIIQEKELHLEAFDAIINHSDITVNLSQGTPQASIKMDANLLPLLKIEVVNHQLQIIPSSSDKIKSNNALEMTIQIPEITHLEQTAAGKIQAASAIITEQLTVIAKGAGDIILEQIDAPQLQATARDASLMVLKGTSQTFTSESTGSARLHAEKLSTQNVQFDCKDAARLRLKVAKQLNGKVSNAGSVTYTGNPKLDVEESEAGSISQWKK